MEFRNPIKEDTCHFMFVISAKRTSKHQPLMLAPQLTFREPK